MRIAVIGTGISGLSAAWALSQTAEVTVYEAATRLGGHTATVEVDHDGTSIPVDTGFIVYNTLNYPNLTAFFEHLGVPTRISDMSFSVSIGRGRLEWAGSDKIWKLFAQPSNLVNPSFLGMIVEIMRFNRVSTADLAAGRLEGASLGDYLAGRGFSARFQTDYLIPMGAAIWSTAVERMLDFPAETFVRFFDNHRLLSFDRPVWRTVEGGSKRYIERILPRLEGRIRLATPVRQVHRISGGAVVTDHTGAATVYDHVVLATHSDQALALLSDASGPERSLLSDVRFQDNDVYLHRDARLMPKRKAAWASWNYLAWPSEGVSSADHVSVTYWMNLLQGIDRRKPLFVSLNPPEPPAPEKVFGRFSYAHPQLDGPALAAQRRLPFVQGKNRVWFAGAWTGFGFHEDGLASGIAVAEALGGRFPWRKAPSGPPHAEAAE